MEDNVFEFLKRHLKTDIGKDSEAMAKFLAGELIMRTEYEKVCKEKADLTQKLEDKYNQIKSMKRNMEKQKEITQHYCEIIQTREEQLEEITDELDRFQEQTTQSDSAENNECRPTSDNKCQDVHYEQLETEIKQIGSYIDKGEKEKAEIEEALQTARSEIKHYKYELGLTEHATQNEVEDKIQILMNTKKNVADISKAYQEADDKCTILKGQLLEHESEVACLQVELECKKAQLAQMTQTKKSKKLEVTLYRHIKSKQQRHNPPKTCANCHNSLTMIQYCEDCYRSIVDNLNHCQK